jgi:hypothetical protein
VQLDLIPRPEASRRAERQRAMAEATARADLGISRAADKADRTIPGWCALACDAVRRFAAHQHGWFTMEQIRLVMEPELPAPPDARSWGQVTRMAKARGYIEVVKGQAFPAASSNGSAKPVYRKGIGA